MLVSDIDIDKETCLCPQCLKVCNLVEPVKASDDEDINLFAECELHGIFFICPDCIEDSINEMYKSFTVDITKLYFPSKDDEDPDDFKLTELPSNSVNYEHTFFKRDKDKEWIGVLGKCSFCKEFQYGYITNI